MCFIRKICFLPLSLRQIIFYTLFVCCGFTCNITGLDLDGVGGELHHHLLVHHGGHLTDHGPLGSSCPGQPLLISEHRHFLCGQVPHNHLEKKQKKKKQQEAAFEMFSAKILVKGDMSCF